MFTVYELNKIIKKQSKIIEQLLQEKSAADTVAEQIQKDYENMVFLHDVVDDYSAKRFLKQSGVFVRKDANNEVPDCSDFAPMIRGYLKSKGLTYVHKNT